MNQEEKREYKALKRKLFGLNTISLIMVNILTFVFVNTIIICLQKFISLNSTITFLILMGTCVIASIIFIISKIVKSHRKKRTKLSFWFTNNFPKLLLYYTILLFLFLSISNTPIWDINEVHEVLSIEWTIFGLSIAIFLVWDVIYINYLKKKQPYATDKMDFIKEYDLLNEKQLFYNLVLTAKTSIILLSINLFFLVLSSALIYIYHMPESVIVQNIVVFTFYLSTNSIVMLFIDILQPILFEHKELSEKNRVTKEEMDEAEGKALVQMVVDTGIKAISEMEDITEERKIEYIKKYQKLLIDVITEDHQPPKSE